MAPMPPLVTEMPHMFKFLPMLFCCGIPWWLALSTTWYQRLVSRKIRVIIYLCYVLMIGFWVPYNKTRYMRVGSQLVSVPTFRWEWIALFPCCAAILYAAAICRGHEYVFSRTLGGSGVEQMSLSLPGPGPDYEAVSEEGRIRLT